jgi:hypothetical protein
MPGTTLFVQPPFVGIFLIVFLGEKRCDSRKQSKQVRRDASQGHDILDIFRQFQVFYVELAAGGSGQHGRFPSAVWQILGELDNAFYTNPTRRGKVPGHH